MSELEPTRLQYPSRTLQALGRIGAMVDALVDMTKEVGASSPSPTLEDIQNLAEVLAEDDSMLPEGTVVSRKTELWNDRYLTVASSVSIEMLGTFTPAQLLSTGLIAHGRWQHHIFERLLSDTPGVVKGRLMGPREVLLDRQRAGQRRRPGQWSTE